jgi:hypothetical protein
MVVSPTDSGQFSINGSPVVIATTNSAPPVEAHRMIDTSIYFMIVVPDGAPEEATPTQGFALSLCMNSGLIRAAALLPNKFYDLTDEGRETVLARRMSSLSS